MTCVLLYVVDVVKLKMSKSVVSKIYGFTLIELLLVVSVIGILSGIGVVLVNQGQQKARAKDAVNRSSLEKIIQGTESYYYAEGGYPLANADGSSPLTNNAALKVYIQSWPTGFTYRVAGNDFAVIVKRNTNGNYYKYYSSGAQILECNGPDDVLTNITACTVVQ